MEDHHQASDKARLGLAPSLDKTVRRLFASVPDFRTTGVRDGRRAYDYEWLAAIRAVNALDAMTADVSEIDRAVLKRITARIPAEVLDVCRVVCDLTPKPTGAIEWG